MKEMMSQKVSGGRNPHVEFCAVRPSNLVDAPERPSEFSAHATLQNGIFNAGATTRANVGSFMADLVTEGDVWERWKDSYPHIIDGQGK